MLYLVRHAHSDYSPDEMRGLSAAGQAAARRVADVLQRCGVSLIVSSPYTRAIQTVQPLADRLGIPIELEPDLRERALGSDPVTDFEQRLAAVWRDFGLRYSGGESSADAQARVRAAVHRIADAAAGRTVLIASHGNALALFLRTLDPQIDHAFWARMTMPDVYAIENRGEGEWSYSRIWTP